MREAARGEILYNSYDSLGFDIKNDYESWKPRFKESCFLGQEMKIVRRKRTAKCWNERVNKKI